MATIVIIESHRLSDGTLAQVRRLGHKYSFMHTTQDGPPQVELNLNKAQAMDLLADTLRDDVLELT